jgi:hypothetical protein
MKINIQKGFYAVLSNNWRTFGLYFDQILYCRSLLICPAFSRRLSKVGIHKLKYRGSKRANEPELIRYANILYLVIFCLFTVLTNPTGGNLYAHLLSSLHGCLLPQIINHNLLWLCKMGRGHVPIGLRLVTGLISSRPYIWWQRQTKWRSQSWTPIFVRIRRHRYQS